MPTGTWLLAPTGATLRRLLDGARSPDLLPRRIAITTPAHLEVLLLRRAGASLARRASLALPTLEPSLSARGALDVWAAAAALGVLGAATALFVLAPTTLALLVGGALSSPPWLFVVWSAPPPLRAIAKF